VANEHPGLKTSASGHVECRTSRIDGGAGLDCTECVCVEGDCSASLRLQFQRK